MTPLPPNSLPELPTEVAVALFDVIYRVATPADADLTALISRFPEHADALRAHWAHVAQVRASAGTVASEVRSDATAPRPDRIGSYQILETLGAGGMGTVYLARQEAPVQRLVALKVIKLGMDTQAVLARFAVERQALALMEHTSIAKVYDAGATAEGRPFFAMEYVQGTPITRYCDEHRLSIEDRLAVFRQVCSGVQHAHGKGVIHRDLTPHNVLVTMQDGKPLAKIIDFGLARATDHKLTAKTMFTEHGVIMGTPEYMSPEQAGLNALDVDIRSDVYTLGVLLYELLTGALPFSGPQLRAAGYDRMCAIIQTHEPERPSTRITEAARDREQVAKLRRTDADKLLRRLRGDLDWVVMKCLEKDRTRRYETVSELAADVQRHLDCEPVLARAPSVSYRLAKLARRYRAQLAAAAAVLVALIAGLGVATHFWLDAAAQATLALARKREFDQLASMVYLEQALAREEALHPPWPDRVPAMKRWLEEDVGRLLAMKPEIEATVQSLRERAVEAPPGDNERDQATPAGGNLRFADESQRFLHDTLQALLGKLTALEASEASAVRQRLAWAEGIEALTLAHPFAPKSWAEARDAIAKADGVVASALYKEHPIDLKPQMGLVPIGMNPVTLLWEFYELRSAWDGVCDPSAMAVPRHIADGNMKGHIAVDDDTGIVFVLLPGKTVTVGSQRDDPDKPYYDPAHQSNEVLHEVTLSPFFLARHELTKGQWKRLSSGGTPSHHAPGTAPAFGPKITWANPVEHVDSSMCDSLMARHGLTLPTEAQWEYGCRAGTTTPWLCDFEQLRAFANVADATAKPAVPGWTCEAWSDGHIAHAPVGSFLPNAFGLFDVHGNVIEWTRDDYCAGGTQPRAGDGLRQERGNSVARVDRGGCYALSANVARSACRNISAASARTDKLGLRPARMVTP